MLANTHDHGEVAFVLIESIQWLGLVGLLPKGELSAGMPAKNSEEACVAAVRASMDTSCCPLSETVCAVAGQFNLMA